MNLESQERIKDKGNYLERYFKSFKHACEGVWYLLTHEHNFVIILCAILITTVLGFIYHITRSEWLFIVACFGSVLGSELINTAIEATVDLVTKKINPLAKLAKDTASSATLVFCIMSLIGALIIFIPKIF